VDLENNHKPSNQNLFSPFNNVEVQKEFATFPH
jgi:hypothetical protein